MALSLVYDFMYDILTLNERQLIQQAIIDDINTDRPWAMRNYLEQPFAHMMNNPLIIQALPLVMGAIALYGENANYTTAQADADIALAKEVILTNENSLVKRMWSPDDGAYLEGVWYRLVSMNQFCHRNDDKNQE